MSGSVSRRCACRDPQTGKQLGQRCAKLSMRRHGTWTVRQELPLSKTGERRTFRRGGYSSRTEGQTDLDKVRALLAIADQDDIEARTRLGDLLEHVSSHKESIPDLEETRRKFNGGVSLTARTMVGEFLDSWLVGRKIRPRSRARYETDIRVHLKPRIAHHRLDRLSVAHLSQMFNDIIEANIEIEESNQLRRSALAELEGMRGRENRQRAKEAIQAMPPFRRTTGPATRQHIKATIRAALNDAITQGLITFNAAAHVEIDSAKRPKAKVWTPVRVQRWQETGVRPWPVMVWTPAQLGRFLDGISGDPLYCLYHLIAFRGLRRGEACGLRWEDVDLDASTIIIATQFVEYDGEIHESAPKSDAGDRVVVLDTGTVTAFGRHRARQRMARIDAGAAWMETGRVFTREDGSWVAPAWLSDHFERLVRRIGLPPIRLHDLRHGAATLAHAGGADMKTIQELLGHTSHSFTADTYASVLHEVALAAAEAAAQLVPRQTVPEPLGLTSGSHRPGKSKTVADQDRALAS